METPANSAPQRPLAEPAVRLLERLGLGPTAAGVILVVLGLFVLIVPEFIRWTLGVVAVGTGILILAQPQKTTTRPPDAPA